MNKTKIEWCDSTWNPVTGCFHGCGYCYARKIAERFKPFDLPHISEKGIFEKLNELDTPIITACKDGKDRVCAYPYGFEPTLHRYRLGEYEKKKGRTIFVCSMADLFGDWVPDSWIEDVFSACEEAPQHRYLFLTKNPKRYIDLANAGKLPAKDNMWYGATATTPDETFFYGGAWHTFVSIEPILRDYSGEINGMCDTFAQWVIVGAETGNRNGKIVPEKSWIDDITVTCLENNISLFFKDSLIPIVGEQNMFRELPWESIEKRRENIKRSIKWLDVWNRRADNGDV